MAQALPSTRVESSHPFSHLPSRHTTTHHRALSSIPRRVSLSLTFSPRRDVTLRPPLVVSSAARHDKTHSPPPSSPSSDDERFAGVTDEGGASHVSLSRRDTCLLALSQGVLLGGCPTLLLSPPHAHASGSGSYYSLTPTPTPIRQLRENFGVAVLLAVEQALVETGKISQYDLQKEFFKLRQQEFAPLRKANFGGLRTLPQELNVNDVPYFNFQSYIQWKVVARKIYNDDERKAFNLAVGRKLLDKFLPTAAEDARASCPEFKLASNSATPSTWIASSSSNLRYGPELSRRASSEQGEGSLFTVAQGGFTVAPRVCSAALEQAVSELLRRLTYINFVENFNVEWKEVVEGRGRGERSSALLQVKLKGPADLEGGVLIRAEENFWQRITSSMLSALFNELGVETTVDEYFSRETYKPKSLLEQAVLALGDPLIPVIDNVDVDSITEKWYLTWG